MKKFIFKLLIISTLVFVIDQIGFWVLQQFRPVDYQAFLESKQDFFKSDQKLDVLIIGDSHIADALNPLLMEENLGLSTFNMGVYHSSPYENYHLLKACLEHLDQAPKYLVLGTNPVMFTKEANPGKYTPLLLPSWRGFYHLFEEGGGLDLSFFFKTSRERDLFVALKNRLLGKPYQPTRIFDQIYNGYLETTNQMKTANFEDFDTIPAPSIQEIQIDYIKKSIELAETYSMQVLVVHPPIWKKKQMLYQSSQLFEEFKSIHLNLLKEYPIKMFNLSHQELDNSLQQKDFLNPEHLNSYGAQKFTKEVISWIKAF